MLGAEDVRARQQGTPPNRHDSTTRRLSHFGGGSPVQCVAIRNDQRWQCCHSTRLLRLQQQPLPQGLELGPAAAVPRSLACTAGVHTYQRSSGCHQPATALQRLRCVRAQSHLAGHRDDRREELAQSADGCLAALPVSEQRASAARRGCDPLGTAHVDVDGHDSVVPVPARAVPSCRWLRLWLWLVVEQLLGGCEQGARVASRAELHHQPPSLTLTGP